MENRKTTSASRQVWLFVLGSFIAASTFPLLSLTRKLPHGQTNGPYFLLWAVLSFLPLAIGFYITIRAQNRLKAAIDAGSYSEDELSWMRSTIGSMKWFAVVLGLLIVSLVCMMFFTLRDEHPHASVWFFLTLGQNLVRLPHVLRKPPISTLTPPSDWRQGPPLQSQQWGGR